MRFIAIAAITIGFLGAAVTGAAPASAGGDETHASCMGLGSSFYARFAPQQRALVAHLVKESFAEAPGEHYRVFAQEKEGGSIPAPCGTRIE